jgi:hypothetical protein
VNPNHANIENPRVWELDGDVVASDQLKVGSFIQEVLKELEVPRWVRNSKSNKIRVKFACLCAREALKLSENPEYLIPLNAIEAAEAWLENPTKKNSYAAYAAAAYAADAAAYAAACNADYAAYAAAYAARAVSTTYYDTNTAYAAYVAASAAGITIDFGKLADEAVNFYIEEK